MRISAASFPTPALALRSTDPGEQRRVRAFASEQATAANEMRSRLADVWFSKNVDRRDALAQTHSDLIRWRRELAQRAPHRLGRGLPLDAGRFLTSLRDGGRNYDRLGYVGRMRDGASWDPEACVFAGGRATPAFQVLLTYGQHALDRFSAEGVTGDVLHNRVVLPGGREVQGNRLVRGAAAQVIGADLIVRISQRGGETSQIETGGDLVYLVTADDDARETMFTAALDLLCDARQDALSRWQRARYLLYQAPVMKKGSDAVTRVFLVAVGAVILGVVPVLNHDVDLRCMVLGQAATTVLSSDPSGVGMAGG